jgi:hypothetical protein
MDATGNESVSDSAPTLRLMLRAGSSPPAGSVVLANAGSMDLRIWKTCNEWGDSRLSFEISRGDHIWHVVRRPQVYTRNVPSFVVVPAGGSHEWPFDLGDDDWIADAPVGELMGPPTQVVAVYDVPVSPEAVERAVWTGRLRSEPAKLDG